MRIAMVSLAASLCVACGSEPGANATLFIDPPLMGDLCVGVAGFEVIVSPTGESPRTTRMKVPSTILAATNCLLPSQISIPDLPIDVPIDVTVHGYDGTGTQVRVWGRQNVPSLSAGDVHLRLVAGPSRFPLLVFHRTPLLDGVPLAKVSALTISKPMGGTGTLQSADRDTAHEFFDPEPGAYGIPGFANDPPAEGTALVVEFTADAITKSKRVIVEAWTGTHYPARPQ